MSHKKKILIIGAGAAGISAARELLESRCEVILIESSKKLGGRANSKIDAHSLDIIDNGQHIFVGAYHNFLKLLDYLGTSIYLKKFKPIKIPFLDIENNNDILDNSKFTGKLGMLSGLWGLNHLSKNSKIHLTSFFLKVKFKRIKHLDLTVKQLLDLHNQTREAYLRFWQPLVLGVLNAPAEVASAKLLLNVLEKAFFTDSDSSAIIIPTVGLSELFEPIKDKFISSGNKILLNSICNQLLIENNNCVGVKLRSGEFIFADKVISTLPPKRLLKVLPEKFLIHNTFSELNNFQYSPITSVFLWFDRNVMDVPFCAVLNSNIQWIFNKNMISNIPPKLGTALISLTISNSVELSAYKPSEIINIILKELSIVLPETQNAKLLHTRVITEKRATVVLTPKTEYIRPTFKSPINNLFLAGDWTATELPATLEGAAISGIIAANFARNN